MKLFYEIKDKLLAQNCKSTVKASCSYRGLNNTKCAGGFAIPDALYYPKMEGRIWGSLCREFPVIEALYTKEEHALITRMQGIHDEYYPVYWPQKLKELENII